MAQSGDSTEKTKNDVKFAINLHYVCAVISYLFFVLFSLVHNWKAMMVNLLAGVLNHYAWYMRTEQLKGLENGHN